jgi:hypothetical protein
VKGAIRHLLPVLLFAAAHAAWAQDRPPVLAPAEKQQVTASLAKLLAEAYVFPDVGEKAARHLANNLANGAYDAIVDPAEFGDRLTADVVAVTADKHFRLAFDPQQVAEERKGARDEEPHPDERLADLRRDNFGFADVRLLDGNIGYIQLNGFEDLEYAADTAAAAMAFVANTEALIIDLRRNHGGDSAMAQFLSSYFFDVDAVPLFDLHTREKNQRVLTQYRTLPYVPGVRTPHRDLYLLTSNFSFSAAEGFAYSLQHREKAVVVGETSGGGANMWTGMIVSDRFYAHMPTTAPIDPVTQTNWEGTGVQPDIAVPAEDALMAAHAKALETLASTHPTERDRYRWYLTGVEAKMHPTTVEPAMLPSFTGTFGPLEIRLDAGKLFLQNRGGKSQLFAIGRDLFGNEDFSYFRLRFVRENGEVTALVMENDNGTSRRFKKEAIPSAPLE